MRAHRAIAVLVLVVCVVALGGRAHAVPLAGFGDFATPNGSATIDAGQTTLTLATGGNQAGTAFTSSPVPIDAFSTSFTFSASDFGGGGGTGADGIAFVLHNDPRTTGAIGDNGGELAYGDGKGGDDIDPSVAMEFNIYQTSGQMLHTDGDVGSYAATSPVNFRTTDTNPFTIDLSYDGAILDVVISDSAATPNVFSTSYAIDIPGTVGGTTAYVGFTGATGGAHADLAISNFSYSPPDMIPEPTPCVLASLGLGLLARRRRR